MGPISYGPRSAALSFVVPDHILTVTVGTIAAIVPSIEFGLSTIIDKRLVGRKVYDGQFNIFEKVSIILVLIGLPHGTISFALERTKFTIPLYIGGYVAEALIAIILGAVQWFPSSEIYVI